MKILKYVVLPLLLIVGIYCLLCFVGPKDFNTEQSIEIDAPKKLSFNLVNNIKAWERWGTWQKRDTAMVISYPGKIEGTGAISTWLSEQEGDGKQEIVESIEGERIKTKLTIDGWDEPSYGYWTFKDSGSGKSLVTWGMESSELPFIMRGMMLVMGMKGTMEKDFKQGLSNLKEIVESRHQSKTYNGYKINDIRLPEKHFILNRQEVDESKIQQFYATNLGSLFSKVQEVGVEMDGMPCGLFYNFNSNRGKIDMAAAIPTKESLIIPDVSSLTMPAKRAIQVNYYGDYHLTEKAHTAIEDFMKDNGLFNDYPVIEEYITDPTTVKDPEKWLTKVTYYISD